MLYNTVMRRVLGMLFILFCLVGLACQAVQFPFTPPTLTPAPSIPSSLTPPPTQMIPPPTQPATSTALPVQSPQPPSGSAGFSVHYHPDGGLYAGDQVSFEVVAPPGAQMDQGSVRVELEGSAPEVIAQGDFQLFGIGRRLQATLIWAWDTQRLPPGDYSLRYTVLPLNLSWSEPVTLLPREDLPLAEQQATWASTTTDCCVVHYITHTAAERDLPQLLSIFDAQAQSASQSMDIEFSQPITITLLPRLLGHGGFASSEIQISYLDRNYASEQVDMIIHHEMVHILDSRLGGDLRPSMLVEGLAVYLTGGHYRPGPLLPRAATLLAAWGDPPQPGLDRYVPLASLADDFYAAQHEIGYMEAGALIDYMVQIWGWPAFTAFYRDIHPDASGSQAQAIDVALQAHFDLSLEQLEQAFLAALRNQPASDALRQDVELTLSYYDTLRLYQRLLDPSAYFLTAWLLDTPAMRQRGIVADYFRHPRDASNLALETLFITASSNLEAGQYIQAEQDLEAINHVLQAVEQGTTDPFSVDPLAAEYLAVIQALLRDPSLTPDYEPQRLELLGIKDETARAWVSGPTAELFEVLIVKIEAGWQLQTPILTGVP